MRVGTVDHLAIELLTLDGLDWQLPLLLGDVVPELEQKMAQAKARNRTSYPIAPEEIITPALECKVNEVYADDLVRYEHIRRRWKMRKKMPAPPVVEGAAPIPIRRRSLRMSVWFTAPRPQKRWRTG